MHYIKINAIVLINITLYTLSSNYHHRIITLPFITLFPHHPISLYPSSHSSLTTLYHSTLHHTLPSPPSITLPYITLPSITLYHSTLHHHPASPPSITLPSITPLSHHPPSLYLPTHSSFTTLHHSTLHHTPLSPPSITLPSITTNQSPHPPPSSTSLFISMTIPNLAIWHRL